MQETTNYRFKKIGLDDSPPDITATNPNWDEADRILKEHEGGIETLNLSTESIYEQLGEKVNYTDLTPVVTAGTGSAYTVTIPTNMVEVTIVPHVNNLAGATLNGIAILDREGNPIEKDALKTNIPTKLVRVGSNFFIASGGDDETRVAVGAAIATDIYSTKDRGCAIDNEGNIYVQGAHYSGWFVEKINPQGVVIWSTEIIASTGSNTYAPINFICEGYLYSFNLTSSGKVVKLTLEGEIVAEYPGLYDINFYQYKINYEEKTIYTTRSKCNFETGVTTNYPTISVSGTNYILNPAKYSNNHYHLVTIGMNNYNSNIWVLNHNLDVVCSINSGNDWTFKDAILLGDCLAVVQWESVSKITSYRTYSLEGLNLIGNIPDGPATFGKTLRLNDNVYLLRTNSDSYLLGRNTLISTPLFNYNYENVTNDDYILRNGSAMWKVKYEKLSKLI